MMGKFISCVLIGNHKNKMQPLEVFRLLTRQMPKRIIIFQLCSLAFMACSVMALFSWHSFSWVIAAFLTSILLITSWVLMRQKCINAWKISQNPQIVYWAHSRELPRRVARYRMKDYKDLTIHLRDGQQCEFRLPKNAILNFTAWLNQQNPSVHWDNYYDRRTGNG